MHTLRESVQRLFNPHSMRYYLFVLGLSLILAILNNIRVDEEKSVTWFGGQEVLGKPDGY